MAALNLLVPAAPAQADPVVGRWAAPFSMGGIAIHASLMRNGDVLFFEYVEGPQGTDLTSRVRTWNHQTGQLFDANTGYPRDLFCVANSMLADGRVLTTGGHDPLAYDYQTGQRQPVGVKETDVYDPSTRRWTAGPVMQQARWYPTNVLLPDQRTLIFGGQARVGSLSTTVESYDALTNTLTTLPATANKIVGIYPRMHLMPNGKILKVGTAAFSAYFDPLTSRWQNVAPMLFGQRQYGGSVLLPGANRVLTFGGRAGPAQSATNTAEILDTSMANPRWQYTTPMSFPRVLANGVVLPDGKVLVIGGGATFPYTGPVKTPELYDPVTETWTSMAPQQAGRMYHGTSLLLPDGRVLSAGQNSGPYSTMGEIFSPPYLFKGARPTITTAPSQVGYGQPLAISSPEAASISTVALIRSGSVTHQIDTDQRYISLNFTRSGTTITTTSPANGALAPPGYYMLFVVNSQGVPSVASWVQVGV